MRALPPWLWFLTIPFWTIAVFGLLMIPEAFAELANSQDFLHAVFLLFLR